MNASLKISLALCLVAATGSVSAQTSSPWSVRAGLTRISPSTTSGNLSAPSFPNTQIDAGADSQPGGGINYRLNDRFAIDVPLALPFRHDLLGAGAIAGTGKIGDVRALPLTVFGQYHFGAAGEPLRPYVGAGPTYALFSGERGSAALTGLTGGSPTRPTSVGIDSRLALSVQAGVTLRMQGPWFLDFMVARTFLSTHATLSTGQSIDVKLDPTTVSLGVGYRF